MNLQPNPSMSFPARSALTFAALLVATACGPRATSPGRAPIVVRGVGLATPESFVHDAESDVYLVSNINGAPLDADDNGFISVVSPEGKLINLKWIDGTADSITLNAPKGMAVSDQYLYVADITTIRRFDRRTGAPRGEFPIPGATFLNDVAAGEDGGIYFTDTGLKAGANGGGFEPTGTDAVYRLWPNGSLDTLARGDSLGRPNGIAVTGDSVWVVGFGSGELYRVVNGGRTDVRKLPTGGLDGLVVANGEVFTSSWEGASLLRGPIGGPFTAMVKELPAPADIGHDLWRHRILIPLFNGNELRIIKLVF